MIPDLKRCPFCGGEAEVERQGTKRESCIISCTECGGLHEGPDEYEMCGYQWNMRVTDQAHAAQELDQVIAERDELKAQVALFTRAALDCEQICKSGIPFSSHGITVPKAAYLTLRSLALDTPDTLARLKTEWQAEALENLAQANSRELIHPQIVMDMAAELRRQAEGGK